jgi:hypothetical protein
VSFDAANCLVLAKLDRFSALVSARDPAVVDELSSGHGFRLVGSEAGESAGSREELAALFTAFFAQPYRLGLVWEDRMLTRHDDVAWICAHCQLEIHHPERTECRPYRLVAVFQKIDAVWRCRLFSGSEPATPPGPWGRPPHLAGER